MEVGKTYYSDWVSHKPSDIKTFDIKTEFLESQGWECTDPMYQVNKHFKKYKNKKGDKFDSSLVLSILRNYENGTCIFIREYYIESKEDELNALTFGDLSKNSLNIFKGWIETEEEFLKIIKQLRLW